jgi:hypothetical protein
MDRTPQGRSTKVAKVRQGFGRETMVSFDGPAERKRLSVEPARSVINPAGDSSRPVRRAALVDQGRLYARDNAADSLMRKQGRITGTVNPLQRSARADLEKRPAESERRTFGRYLPTPYRG